MVNTLNLKKTILMVPVLLAAAMTAARPLAPKVEVQCILVAMAQIARHPAREGKFGHANYGHQIAPGTESVLAIRIYDDPDRGPDSQTFTKATLELNLPQKIAKGSEVAVEVLRSHYAEGSSGWVHKGEYWWAKNAFRRVYFRRDSSGLLAILKSNVNVTYAAKIFPRPPETISVDVTCRVRKLGFLQLPPWTGRVGTDWLSFYSQGIGD